MRTKSTHSMTPDLSPELLEKMAQTLKLLAHPHRLRIVEILDQRGHAPVFEIMHLLELPQAVTSQHLNAMRRVGLLCCERRGKEVWYAIANPHALTILDCIRQKSKVNS